MENPSEIEAKPLEEAPEESTDKIPEELTKEELPVIETPEEVFGEDMGCIVCGKKLKAAFPGKPVETIRKWADSWLEKYGVVFCCKDHLQAFESGAM